MQLTLRYLVVTANSEDCAPGLAESGGNVVEQAAVHRSLGYRSKICVYTVKKVSDVPVRRRDVTN